MASYFMYILELLLILNYLGNADGKVEQPTPKNTFSSSNNFLIDTCINVANGLSYYDELIKNYDYDRKCLMYKEIGNFVLEKYKLERYNCYSKIQKSLCKIRYVDIKGDQKGKEKCKTNNIHVSPIIQNIGLDKNVEISMEKNNSSIMNDTTEQHDSSLLNIDNENSHCDTAKDLFISLIKKCTENKYKDELVHCATFDIEKNVILNGETFCERSYERKMVEDTKIENKKYRSVYGNNIYKKLIIKPIKFKKHEYSDCVNMVNIYNNCSVVEQKLTNNKDVEFCLLQRSNDFCNSKIKVENNKDYINTCSDIILPYLLSSKNDDNLTYIQMCYDISNYIDILDKKKLEYLKQKKKYEQNISNINITQKLYKIIKKNFQILNEENDKYYEHINNLFNILLGAKQNNKLLLSNHCITKLNNLNDKTDYLYNKVNSIEYPDMNANLINDNIAFINKNKINIEDIIKIQMDISAASDEIRQCVNEKEGNKKSDNKTRSDNIHKYKDTKFAELNYDELNKMKHKGNHINKLIQNYATKSNNSILKNNEELINNFKNDIKKMNIMIEVFTSQINLLIKNGFSSN
ncbi:conserved Plasmodium protein, unknown function [Plasmodium chabaudi chabaudi]|uniref:Reticulocyte binding protein n=1 Tax=Plasmodium chabaudi chabaudi TaxID=31271 RepID=A0A4V6M945_PLACU|nr:conserved Plasmodium protein, unknown function [Plasmodium chabaudi chabaudi]VTZ68007.1 conserved Plasmodium protein, unknown function [Plasmodium chabaudi chabaudi]|eukprot:XP_743597.2 conserved Plasmodium protein, unknown function [Plasmodium chabaudi chabaudi]